MAAVASSSRVMLRAAAQSAVPQRSVVSLWTAAIGQAARRESLRGDELAGRRWHSTRREMQRSAVAVARPFFVGKPSSQATSPRQWARSYATAAYTEATPNSAHMKASQAAKAESHTNEKQAASEAKEEEEQGDPDEPPKKASIRERLRFLMRRYGWWALGVYLLASVVDFSLVFAAIHMLGADHIRSLEDQLRRKLGMGERKMDDHEVAAWPVPIPSAVEGTAKQVAEGGVANNQQAARQALVQRGNVAEAVAGSTQGEAPAQGAISQASSSSSSSSSSSTLWTEAVLAYTIHKTLLLPFRVGVTAAITPSFVKYLVRHGWARNNAAVHQAAARAQAVKATRKATKGAAGGAAASSASGSEAS